MSGKTRAHIFVSGRVQGVFFRDSAVKKALELSLAGWVRNLDDGRVEAVAEGCQEKVSEMISWFHEGPALAEIEKVDVAKEEYLGDLEGFEIKR